MHPGDPKRAAGEAAALLVEDGMAVGLGTGSTAVFFIMALGARVRSGLDIRAAVTSRASERLAVEQGIAVVELDADGLDLTVDGADAIDPELRLIKGFGAAHVREKIVAAASRQLVVVADESKMVDRLAGRVPVEVLPFGASATLVALNGLGAAFTLRAAADGTPIRSDNGNLIGDGAFGVITDPEGLATTLDAVPGVIGHGLFLGMADRVLVGGADGTVRSMSVVG